MLKTLRELFKTKKNLNSISDMRDESEGFSSKINYFGFIEDGIMINIDGSLMSSFWFRGEDLESSTNLYMQSVSAQINMALMVMDEGWMIHVDSIRYHSNNYIDSNENYFPNAICELIDEERRKLYEQSGNHFENAFVLNITWLPPQDMIQKLGNFFIKSDDKEIANIWQMNDIALRFKKSLKEITDRLDLAFPLIKQMNNNEMLTYLNKCINGLDYEISVPKNPLYLQQILANQDAVMDSFPKIGKQYVQVISVKGFPNESYPGMMHILNEITFEYRWTTRFIFMQQAKAKKEIDQIMTYWATKRMGIKGWLATTFNPESRVNESVDALSKERDATLAMAEVDAGYIKAGYYTNTIVIWDEDLNKAKGKAEEISKIIWSLGFANTIEEYNAVDAYFGSLPGYGYQNVRKPHLNTLVLADLLPQTSIWAGLARNPCPYYLNYNNPPLMYAETNGSTPFRLNLHAEDDLGHTLIIGPAGSGKSTLLGMIVAQHMRYKFAKVFYFDKGCSIMPLCHAINGQYYDILNPDGDELTFQPLLPPKRKKDDGSDVDLTSFIAWVESWVLDICKLQNVEINSNVVNDISQAVKLVLTSFNSERIRIDELHSACATNEVQQALKTYLSGNIGSFLDGDKDLIKSSNFTVFEMEHLLHTNNQILIYPTISYLFQKITQQLTGSPTLIILDELSFYLKTPLFRLKIEEWLKTLRKLNVVVVMATQEIEDILNTDIATTIINQTPTKIYLANPDAVSDRNKPCYESLRLNDVEIEIISQMPRKKSYYYKSVKGRRRFDLGLNKDDTPIALNMIGRSSKEDLMVAKKLKKEHLNNFAYYWLKHWGKDKQAEEWLKLHKRNNTLIEVLMTKKNVSQYGTEMPFLDRKREFVEMYGRFVVREKIGYIFGVLGIIFGLIFGVWAITVQHGITHEPYVILKDEIGQLTPIGPQNRVDSYIDDKVVKAELYKYIMGLRYISTDINVTQHNWYKTKKMTSPMISGKILDILSQHLASIGDGNWVDPKITEIYSYNGGKSWQIKWKEELNGKDDVLTNTYWNADISLNFMKPTKPIELYENPAGIIVTTFKLDQVVK